MSRLRAAVTIAGATIAAAGRAAAQIAVKVPGAGGAGGGTMHVVVSPSVHYPFDWDALVSAIWAGLPAAVAAFVFARWITNRWDLAKKRNEFDLELTRAYYEAVGTFKALGRQSETLGRRPPQEPTALVTWNARRENLGERAIELEGRIDAILAKAILEDSMDRTLSSEERLRRRHLAGLLRVSVRNLREGLQHGDAAAPSFNSPGFWLSNRIVSELGQILYGRALKPRASASLSQANASDYLELITYRTADLHIAAAALTPHITAFNRARISARKASREANLRRLLRAGGWEKVTALDGHPPAIPLGARLAVEIADDTGELREREMEAGRRATMAITDGEANDASRLVFAGVNNVNSYILLADQESRVVLIERGQPPRVFSPIEELPRTLLWSAPGPHLAADLLRWSLSEEAREALRRLATEPITPE